MIQQLNQSGDPRGDFNPDEYFESDSSGYPTIKITKAEVNKKGTWPQAYSEFIRKNLYARSPTNISSIGLKRGEPRFKSLLNVSKEAIAPLCPGYHQMNEKQKEDFWVVFFVALAYAETDFNKDNPVKTGLNQLTHDKTATGSYKCKSKNKAHLKNNPFVNIDCAMKIITHWSHKRQTLVKNHPYFDTLRMGKARYRDAFLSTVSAWRPPGCIDQGSRSPGTQEGGRYVPVRVAPDTYRK